MKQRPSDEELVAFLDGELGEAESAALSAWLERDPALRARFQALSEVGLAVRESFDEVLREPVPERLLLAATAKPAAEVLPFRARRPLLGGHGRRWIGFAVAASVCGLVFGGPLGYLAGGNDAGRQVQTSWLDNIAGYHNLFISSADGAENAVFDVPAGAEQKLPGDVHIPDLKPWSLGFQGARMMVVEGRPAYQFFYTTDNKELGAITLTVWPSGKGDMQPTFDRRDNVNLMYWRHAGHGYAIVGQANKGYMWGLAQDIAWQLRGG